MKPGAHANDPNHSPLREAIRALVQDRRDLGAETMRETMRAIMEGRGTDAQIAAFLVGLRMKGETVEEILGAAEAMRAKARRLRTIHDPVLDTCGTGGDGAGTFNISTITALVAAGAGACVAKHGNYSVSSRCGSADLLEALGIDIRLSYPDVERCLDEGRIAFLFAPLLHEAMKFAIAPRREIGVRSIFNLLGPLTNPAGAKRQLLGVYGPALTEPIATVLARLGAERAWVVYSEEGTDEITLGGRTFVSEVEGGRVRNLTLSARDFGLASVPVDAIRGGPPETNASIALSVLAGEPGPARETILANTAAALLVSGTAGTLAEGIDRAIESIDSGAARGRLEFLRSRGRGPERLLPEGS
ncbi:MAG: anthranilate phosphoribosyltransferase [Candidatus Eisenbacteria bacterium]|nr:anthranilate phosphoribosyltransferase [Candidatus Eisenbacteria bacterium]